MFTSEDFREPPSQDYGAAIVRFYKDATVSGAGFRVSEHYILTCAHVVNQCLLGKKSAESISTADMAKPLEIDFPVDPSKQRLTVKIVPELWQVNGEDIAVLKLTSPAPSDARVMTLKSASPNYWEHRFAVYGFPLKRSDGRWVDGKLLGSQPGTDRVQMEGTRAEGLGIAPGFSGSPVWNEMLGGVVGMVVARDTEESAKIGFMIPYQQLKPALEAIALFELLLPEASTLAPHWDQAYRLLKLENSTEPYPKTLEAAIRSTQDMSNQGSDYPAIAQFIGYLALPELGLTIQPQLLEWLRTEGVDVNAVLAAVRQKKADRQAQQAVSSTPHLLFWVQAELNRDRYAVQAYLVRDREQYDPLKANQIKAPEAFLEKSGQGTVEQSEIAEILRACLIESAQTLGDIRQLRVEVFLPLHHVDWAVDQWPVTHDPEPDLMGCRYQVVVRIVQRWQESYSQYRGDWEGKWTTLRQFPDRPANRGFICGDGHTFKKLRQQLRQADVTGLILTQRLTHQPEGTSNPLLALVHTGAPAAIWPRPDFKGSSEQFKQLLVECHHQFDHLFNGIGDQPHAEPPEAAPQNQGAGLLGCCLSELPERVRVWREQADQDCEAGATHIAQQIGFIWEDPKLVPPSAAIVPRLRISA